MVYFELFIEFFKTGLFSVGGGLATLPFLYDIAARKPWFTEAQLLDMIAISESTPGPIGVNMATYAGYNAAGIPGAVLATVSLLLPSMFIITIISKFLTKFSESQYVQDAFYGLRPVVAALIAGACFQLMQSSIFNVDLLKETGNLLALFNIKAILLFAVLMVLSRFNKHPIFYLAGAAVVGIIFKF